MIRFAYEIRNRQTDRVLCTGETVHVVTDRDLKPARLPEPYGKYFMEH